MNSVAEVVDLLEDEDPGEDEDDDQDHELEDDLTNDLNTVTIPHGLVEEKPTYEYKKLVVPMSMRSIYWKYFGFPATAQGDILTKVKIVCIICKTQIAYNRNTSNLKMHLQNRHIAELNELEAQTPPNKPNVTQESKEKRAKRKMLKNAAKVYTAAMDGTVQLDTSGIRYVTADQGINLASADRPLQFIIQKKDTLNSQDNITFVVQQSEEHNLSTKSGGSNLSNIIAEFLITDLQLPDIVMGKGFQRLIGTLRSPCEIPNKHQLEEDIIPKLYENFRLNSNALMASLDDQHLSLSIEEWKSDCGEAFMTFTVYHLHQDQEPSLESRVMGTIHAPEDLNEVQWGNQIDSLLSGWNMSYKNIVAIVMGSNRRELINAIEKRDVTVVACLMHVMQTATEMCFKDPQIAPVLAKCRSVIGLCISNGTTAIALQAQEHTLEIEDFKSLTLDYPPVWTTTYSMLEQLLARRSFISDVLLSVANAELDEIDLLDEHWSVIEILVEVLEPFKATVMTLSDEKMPLISLVKPLLWQLVSAHLKINDTDSPLAASLKQSMSEILCERYSDARVSLLLQIGTILDPRFKEVPYASDAEKKLVARPIKEMIADVMQKEGEMESRRQEEMPSKKSRLSGMLGGVVSVKQEVNSKDRANLEFAMYQSEPSAPLDCCPLVWWKKMSAKSPNLMKTANRYHCIPVCCAPPSRIPSEAQTNFSMKRAALPPKLVDKVLCLHSNTEVQNA